MKTTFLSLLFLFGGLMSIQAQTNPTVAPAGNGSTNKVDNPPVMTFKKLEYNYGKIEQGKSVTYEFLFQNTGKSALVISNAQGSCGCTVPEWPKEPIAPGKTGKIKVTFNSAGKMGLQDKTVTLTSNNKDGNVVLHMKGEVIAAPAPTGDKVEK